MKVPVNHGHYKLVPPEGGTVYGYYLPGGLAVGHNSQAFTHNPAIFGRDVDLFRPERFLAPECLAGGALRRSEVYKYARPHHRGRLGRVPVNLVRWGDSCVHCVQTHNARFTVRFRLHRPSQP